MMKQLSKKSFPLSLLVKPPRLIRFFSRNNVWKIETSEKQLFLTFDDGPVEGLTPWVLDTLDQFEAKATFFCVGDNVRKNPEIYSLIQEKGHQVGNHTYSHLNGFRTGIRKYVIDVFRAKKYIHSMLFRPPYGRIRFLAQRILSTRFKIILWDVLSMDYNQNIDPQQVVRNVIDNVSPGSIIVFHDNYKADKNLKYALPQLLAYYSKRGYEFVPLP